MHQWWLWLVAFNPEKPYQSAPDFRAALLDILNGFASRYPNKFSKFKFG